jgi:hypothetical protein
MQFSIASPSMFLPDTETDPLQTFVAGHERRSCKVVSVKFDPDLGLRLRRNQILTIPVR